MKLVELTQKSDEWLKWRNGGLTATDARVILGLDPEKTPYSLWCEKTGRLAVKDLSVVPAVRYGIEHEEVARELYNERFNDLVTPVCGQWETDSGFKASFDGIDLNGNPVEFKCPLPGGKPLADIVANKEKSEAYKQYYPQVQHQLLVSDKSFGHLVFFEEKPEGSDVPALYVFRIERDEKMIRDILTKGREFLKHLKDDTPPERGTRDLYTPKGEAAYRWSEVATLYKGIFPQIERLTAQRDALKQQLIDLMGQETAAIFSGIAVTISTSKASVDYEKALKSLLGRELTDEEKVKFAKKGATRVNIRTIDEGKNPVIDPDVKLEEVVADHEPLRCLLI